MKTVPQAAEIRKSLTGFVTTLLALVLTDLIDGNDGVTLTEFWAYVGSSLAAAGLVWRIPNQTPRQARR